MEREEKMLKTADKKTSAALAEIVYKTAKMGGESITDILPKIKSGDNREVDKMRTELTRQFSKYEEISAEAERYLSSLNCKAEEENLMVKLSAKAGIAMNTVMDASPSHIASMMVEGLAMGITEITAKLREAREAGCDEKIQKLASDLVSFQESAVDEIKKFL